MVAAFRRAGAEHVAVYVTADQPLDQFERLVAALPAAGVAGLEGTDQRSPWTTSAHIVGTAMTPMNRRDRTAEEMAHQVVADALADAGIDPTEVNLVVFGNATAGRLVDQGCIRGQTFLRRPGCAMPASSTSTTPAPGAPRPCTWLAWPRWAGPARCWPSGVEKMWTGDRAGTLAGIEDGVPLADRIRMHEELENPSGSVLMALNAAWTVIQMEERDATVEQFAAAAVKSRRHGALNPNAQFQTEVTVDEVLGSPSIVWPLTRLMCSSFTDGAAAVVLSARAQAGRPADPGQHHPIGQRRHGLSRPAGRSRPGGLGRRRHRPRRRRRGRAARRHQRRGALRPRVARASSSPATPDRPRWPGDTTIGGQGVTVNTSGGLVARGHPLGATGIAQVVELTAQLRDEAGATPGGGGPIGGGGQYRWHDRSEDASVHRNPRTRGGLSHDNRPDMITTTRRHRHRLGHRRARQGGDQRRPVGDHGHQRRLDPGADRHPGAADRRHHLPAGHRGRDRRPGQGRQTPRRDRRGHPGHHHPGPDRAGHLGHRAGRHRRPGGAFDVNAACSGFVYALTVAHGMLAIGAERLLVIGSETLSRITDWDDRSVAVLVGDGAGAVVLEAVDGPGQLLSWILGADGSLRHLLKCDHGGYLYMDGKEIFRKAVRVVVESAEQAIAEAGLTSTTST